MMYNTGTLDQRVWTNPPLYYRTLATLDRLTCRMSRGALTKLEIAKLNAVLFRDLLYGFSTLINPVILHYKKS